MIKLLFLIVSASTTINVQGHKVLWVGASSNNQISYEIISGSIDIQIKGPFYMRHLPIWRVEITGNGSAIIEYPDPAYIAPGKYYSDEFAKLYQNLVINTVVVEPPSQHVTRGTGAKILIITPSDQFVEKLTPLLEWKMQSGKSVYIATTDETGTSFNSIRDYISNAYFSWDIPPEYIILAGNENLVPAYIVYDSLGCQGYFAIDNPYVSIEGNDYLADAFIGRMSVSNIEEMHNLVTKTINYEKYPDTLDPSWLDRATFFTDVQYLAETLYSAPKETARVFLMDSLGFVHVDTFYLHEDWWQYSYEDLINAVEEGRGFLNYRGNAGGIFLPPWYGFEPNAVHNGLRTPIGVIVTCGLADFLTEPSESEDWIREYDTLDQREGFVAFVGTSGCVFGDPLDPNFHTRRRNALDVGFFLGLNDMPSPSLGYLLESGRIRMLNQYPVPEIWAQYHYEEFLILGDPDLRPWKTTPHSVDVDYPVQSPQGPFTVTVSKNGVPISNAYVTLYHDSTEFYTDTTDINGSATFLVNFFGIALVTVTGDGIYPYQNLAFFGPDDQSNIYLLYSDIVDSILGNSNGFPNPGETLSVYIRIVNSGGVMADSVRINLSTLTPGITPIDSITWITSIAPGQIVDNTDLSFRVLPETAPSDTLGVILTIQNGTQVIVDTLKTNPVPMNISLRNYGFVSQMAPQDSIPLPGEQGEMYVLIQNDESIEFSSIILKLRIPQAEVIDSVSVIAPLNPDTTTWNFSDPFRVFVPSGITPGTVLPGTLIVSFNNGAKEYLPFKIMVGKVDYLILPLSDSSGSPYEIDSILTELGYRGAIYNQNDFPFLYRNSSSVFLIAGQSPHHRDLVEGLLTDALWRTLKKGKLLYIEGNRLLYQRDSIRFLQAIPLRYEEIVEGMSIDSIFSTQWSPSPGQWFHYDNTDLNEFTKVLSGGGGTFVSLIARVTLESGSFVTVPAAYKVSLDTVKAFVTTLEFARLIEGETGWKSIMLDSIMRSFDIIPEVNELIETPTKPLRILPNPTKDYIVVQSPEDFVLKVFDITGRMIIRKSYSTFGNKTRKIRIDIPSGVYIARLRTKSGRSLERKIVLVH